MPADSEKDRRTKLLALLLALTSRVERGVTHWVRPILLSVAVRLRRIVEQLPESGIFRAQQWAQLRERALPELVKLEASLRTALPSALVEMELGVREAAASYRGLPTPPPGLTPLRSTLDRLPAGGASLGETLGDSLRPGRVARRAAVQLDQTVQTMMFRNATTAEIAEKVVGEITRKGVRVPVLKTGSFANRVWNNVKNLVVEATWQVVNTTAQEVWQSDRPLEWQWEAVLDPKTCPVCRPLDKMVRSSPAAFPYQPPVHPNCRCVVLPIQRS